MRILVLLGLLVAACAPSPLYVRHKTIGTPGEIPRDARGEPMWDKIGPPRVGSTPAPVPPLPAPPR